jgi:TonB family protein
LSWTILPDGDILDIRIEQSSGRADLDRLAFDALRRAENLGRLPPDIPRQGIRVSLAFQFGQ